MAEKEKARKLCYERRAACIIKKAMELQILCGLKIGVVILSPDGKLESWPPELNDAKALLDACKERPGVKSDKKRKEDPESCHSCREILVSKLQLLNQREEFFKGKEIASTSETLLRSKKRKDFPEEEEEGCLEILNSKLELLKKREMVFLNRSGNSAASAKGKEIVSMEGIESLFDGVGVAYGQEEGDFLTQNLYDDLWGGYDEFFFNFEEEEDKSNNPQNNAATFKGKQIATAAEECGELQVRKKARLQYPTPALNNNLPLFTPAEYWKTVFTNAGRVNSTDAMLSLLEDF